MYHGAGRDGDTTKGNTQIGRYTAVQEVQILIDITVKISPDMQETVQDADKSICGALGAHFNMMDKEFLLEYIKRRGAVYDVSETGNREICSGDIDMGKA